MATRAPTVTPTTNGNKTVDGGKSSFKSSFLFTSFLSALTAPFDPIGPPFQPLGGPSPLPGGGKDVGEATGESAMTGEQSEPTRVGLDGAQDSA